MTEENFDGKPLEVVWKRKISNSTLTNNLPEYKIINLENIGLVKRKDPKSKDLNGRSKNVKLKSMNNHLMAKKKLFSDAKKSFQKCKINKNIESSISEDNLTSNKRPKSPEIQSNHMKLNNKSETVLATFETTDSNPKSPVVTSNRLKFKFENKAAVTNEIELINSPIEQQNLKLQMITKNTNNSNNTSTLKNDDSITLIPESLYEKSIKNTCTKKFGGTFVKDILRVRDNYLKKSSIESSPPNFSQKYIPIIESCNSPNSCDTNNLALINTFTEKSPTISPLAVNEPGTSLSFESQEKNELPYKIDSLESPPSYSENNNLFTPTFSHNFANNKSPSPTQFDSAKKKKKLCKTGYKGIFSKLLNRKKSEICIQNFEKRTNAMSRSSDNTFSCQVIDVFLEYRKIVLLCSEYKLGKSGKQVIVVLDKSPKKISKYDKINLYAPWIQVDSINPEFLIFFGVINLEIIETNGKSQCIDYNTFDATSGKDSFPLNKTTLWKCSCSKNDNCSCQEIFEINKGLQILFL